MSTAALFDRLRHMLESSGMPNMLTGSYASAVHGTPRATQDIDIVIGTCSPRTEETMRYLGMDVHVKSTLWCLLDAAGEVVEKGKSPLLVTSVRRSEA